MYSTDILVNIVLHGILCTKLLALELFNIMLVPLTLELCLSMLNVFAHSPADLLCEFLGNFTLVLEWKRD